MARRVVPRFPALTLAAALLLTAVALRAQVAVQVARPAALGAAAIAPELRAAMDAAAPGEQVQAYLVMADQLDPDALAEQVAGLSRTARRAAVAQRLQAHAAASQQEVTAVLEAAVAAGAASDVRALWMGNAVVFRARPAVIEQLARLAGVDRIRLVVDDEPSAYQDAGAGAPSPKPVAPRLAQGVASYPFFDDFESGALEAWWSVETTGAGYEAVTGQEGPVGGFHLVMASATDGVASTASVTVALDLVGQTGVGVRFQHKQFGDENDAEDGVFISPDGVNWYLALSLQGGSLEYSVKAFDLDQVVASYGLAYTSDFRVRFQWKDNFNIPTDGFGFDEIEVGPGVGRPPPLDPEPNLVALQAPQLWAAGFTGQGVVLGTIDSGVSITHPDLLNRIWTNPGEIAGNGLDDDSNGLIDDVHGWDFFHGNADVTSGDPHGTSTAGIAVGDGGGGKLTGMAPGAQLLVTEVNTEAQYWLAQQYCLLEGVDAITSSYSYKWIQSPKPDYHMHRQLCRVELAAGVAHANSIGNQGLFTTTYPIPFNIATPGNCPPPFWHPDAAAAGRSSVLGCGGIEAPSDVLYSSSGRGPAAWEDMTLYEPGYSWPQLEEFWDYPFGGFGGGQPALPKPDLVAYTNVTTATIGGGYTTFGGTSAATPHLGGALALLLSSQPQALPRHLAAALELSAVDLGDPGKDNLFGAGKIAVFDAARRLRTLARTTDETPSLGGSFAMDLYGPANAQLFGWYGAALFDNPTAFNLAAPWFELGVFPLGPAGHAAPTFAVPPLPVLLGLTVWFQFGAKNDDLETWGTGPLISVPEPITISS